MAWGKRAAGYSTTHFPQATNFHGLFALSHFLVCELFGFVFALEHSQPVYIVECCGSGHVLVRNIGELDLEHAEVEYILPYEVGACAKVVDKKLSAVAEVDTVLRVGVTCISGLESNGVEG